MQWRRSVNLLHDLINFIVIGHRVFCSHWFHFHWLHAFHSNAFNWFLFNFRLETEQIKTRQCFFVLCAVRTFFYAKYSIIFHPNGNAIVSAWYFLFTICFDDINGKPKYKSVKWINNFYVCVSFFHFVFLHVVFNIRAFGRAGKAHAI